MLPKPLNGFAAIARLGRQQHIRLIVDDGDDPLAHQRMIINAKDADGGLITHFSFLSFVFGSCFLPIKSGYPLSNFTMRRIQSQGQPGHPEIECFTATTIGYMWRYHYRGSRDRKAIWLGRDSPTSVTTWKVKCRGQISG